MQGFLLFSHLLYECMIYYLMYNVLTNQSTQMYAVTTCTVVTYIVAIQQYFIRQYAGPVAIWQYSSSTGLESHSKKFATENYENPQLPQRSSADTMKIFDVKHGGI